jgi:hypothetical protein
MKLFLEPLEAVRQFWASFTPVRKLVRSLAAQRPTKFPQRLGVAPCTSALQPPAPLTLDPTRAIMNNHRRLEVPTKRTCRVHR